MTPPPEVTVVRVDSEKVADWSMTIKLRPDVLALLEQVAGPTVDDRFLVTEEQFDPKTETWTWYIDWGGPDAGIFPGKRVIAFWFTDVRHAVYFKTLWGGV